MGDAQVTAWLRGAGLSRFGGRFAAAGVATPRFLGLSPRELDALGVDGPADRKRLADLIGELRRARAMPPLPAAAPPPPPRRAASMLPETRAARAARERAVASEAAGAEVEECGAEGEVGIGVGVGVGVGGGGEREERAAMPAVRVCVRKRPLSRRDEAAGERDIISCGEREDLFVHEVKTRLDLSKYVESHEFAFDRVFDDDDDNATVYAGTAAPLVDALFAGWRSTCFAYGQTGTGKTYTMEGTPGNPGLYLLAVEDVFARAAGDPELGVWISFFEIYGTRLHDLLNGRALVQCREDSASEVRIQGLTERRCDAPEHVLSLIAHAAAARSTGVTGANDDSSRSHAVFQIELRRRRAEEEDAGGFRIEGAVEVGCEDEEVGRLSFIDLAGSERGSDTASATTQTRREGAEINKSLLALKECIRAMDQGSHHTPFRGSKLTQVLKASFVGRAKCRTVMIANVSPASPNVEHTLNTLRYSSRVKEMKGGSPDRGSGGYTYGVPTSRGFNSRSLVGSRSVHGTPVTSPTLVPLKSELLQMQKDMAPLSAAERKLRRTSSSRAGAFGDPRRHTMVGIRGASQSGRISYETEKPAVRGASQSGRIGYETDTPKRSGLGIHARNGKPVDLDANRDRAQTSNRPGTMRRRLPTLIPGRTRRSSVAPVSSAPPDFDEVDAQARSEDGLLQDASLQLAAASEAAAPTSRLENGKGVDNEQDGSALQSTRRLSSEPSHSPRFKSRAKKFGGLVSAGTSADDLGVSPGEGSEVSQDTGDTQTPTSRPRSAGAKYNTRSIAAGLADDGGDESPLYPSTPVLASTATTSAPGPNAAPAVPTSGVVRTRRMMVPSSARRKPADTPSVVAREDPGGVHGGGDGGDGGVGGDGDGDGGGGGGSEQRAAPSHLSAETTRVAKLHHEKARELTDLVRAGVELMHSVEAGDMAPGLYATKLELNLAMCMDIVHTLKGHVATLGAMER